MTENEARAHAEGLALSMGITFYVVRARDGEFLPVQRYRKTARLSQRSSRPSAQTIDGSSKR